MHVFHPAKKLVWFVCGQKSWQLHLGGVYIGKTQAEFMSVHWSYRFIVTGLPKNEKMILKCTHPDSIADIQ